jgi:hypothetical protein
MKTNQEIEALLYELSYPVQPLRDGMWVISDDDDGIDNIVVHHEDPLLTVRVKVMQVPAPAPAGFYEALLRLNASDLVHGAYGIEGDSIVLIDTLQSANVDRNELQASIDSLVLALTSHYERLSQYRAPAGATSDANS